MTRIEYRNERLYQKSILILKKLHRQKVITKEEFKKMEQLFKEKYQPEISVLFSQLT